MNTARQMIVIEMRGGNVVEVYSRTKALSVVVVDWDKTTSESSDLQAADWPHATLSQMPDELAKLLRISGG
jgi:hypothetical protein